MTTSLTTLESILAHPRELSEEHATVIRATLPVIGAHIDEITPVFYRTMFADNPELLRDTFNRGNQKLGAQQRALAASIATFATLLVDADAARAMQLMIEYDPQPPFDAGSVEKAGAEVMARLTEYSATKD